MSSKKLSWIIAAVVGVVVLIIGFSILFNLPVVKQILELNDGDEIPADFIVAMAAGIPAVIFVAVLAAVAVKFIFWLIAKDAAEKLAQKEAEKRKELEKRHTEIEQRCLEQQKAEEAKNTCPNCGGKLVYYYKTGGNSIGRFSGKTKYNVKVTGYNTAEVSSDTDWYEFFDDVVTRYKCEKCGYIRTETTTVPPKKV